VKVKDGFARNYLLPNKKALRANDANRKLFETNRAKIEADNADRRSDAEKSAKGVDGKTVQLIRQARTPDSSTAPSAPATSSTRWTPKAPR
jgi:large subunit ribosomal protein L9